MNQSSNRLYLLLRHAISAHLRGVAIEVIAIGD